MLLAGCEEGTGLLSGSNISPEEASNQTTLVEREVEAPEVFQATENGLWDGRPSFGGVWVTFPDVKNPEQVIIRNEANGKFVIGALFDRERDNPGPRLTVSSDAASALGMLAGQPTPLNVTALRKEQVEIAPPVAEAPPAEAAPIDTVETETLDDPLEAAAAAIDRAEGAQVGDITPADATPAPTPTPTPAAAPASQPKSTLDKPFIQIGIFSVEANANRTGDNLRKAGVVPTVKRGEVKGKPFWRVIVGPAGTKADRAALLEKARELGFADAYFVTN